MESTAERADTVYLRVLGRYPSESERAKVVAFLEAPEAKPALAQARATADLFWTLLNSAEFNLNH